MMLILEYGIALGHFINDRYAALFCRPDYGRYGAFPSICLQEFRYTLDRYFQLTQEKVGGWRVCVHSDRQP
jgi:hypothetical protein